MEIRSLEAVPTVVSETRSGAPGFEESLGGQGVLTCRGVLDGLRRLTLRPGALCHGTVEAPSSQRSCSPG